MVAGCMLPVDSGPGSLAWQLATGNWQLPSVLRPRRILGHHVIPQLRVIRHGALLGELQRLGHALAGLLVHLLNLLVGERADLLEPVPEDKDRIAVLVLLDFVLGAVGLEDVRRAVAGEAIRHRLDAVRYAGLAHLADDAIGHAADGEDVLPV